MRRCCGRLPISVQSQETTAFLPLSLFQLSLPPAKVFAKAACPVCNVISACADKAKDLLIHSIGLCVCSGTSGYLSLCDPMDCSLPPGSSAHGILQAGILQWVTTPSSRGSSRPRD